MFLDHRHFTLCSIYLPPGIALPRLELRQLVAELPSPFLLLGDFNAHNILCGCRGVDTRGRVLERFIHEELLSIFNTGTRTHFAMPSGSTSALDLSLATPQLMPLFTWHVADDPMGSDHFPVWLTYQDNPSLGARPKRWNLRKADWDEFEASLEDAFSTDSTSGLIPSVEDFTSKVIDAARRSIPRTSGAPHRTPVPWWTEECREAIRARRRALRAFDRHATTENLIAFRQARAAARRTILQAKRASWREYVGRLNRCSPISQVWSQVKQISASGTGNGNDATTSQLCWL